MFLHLLSAEQQIAFSRAAMLAVHADGELDDREAVLLDELQEELGLPELPPVPSRELVEDDLRMFSDETSRRIFLLELASVVTADEERHPDEIDMLRDWATKMGEPPETLDRYLDVSDRAHGVYREARSLVLDGLTTPSR